MRLNLFAIALIHLALAGCAGHNLYSKLSQTLAAGDCPAAAQLMADSRNAYGSNSELLYLLDSAMVGLQCRDFQAAQEHLHAAEDLADKLWTESVSRNAAAMVTNDYVLPYSGEDYERVMIHIVSAIGYLQMNQLDEALVEIRRLDSLLSVFAEKYQDDHVYSKDAFARYLSGMLHEADGADDDAFIDYLKAAGIYQQEQRRYGVALPEILVQDLLRVAAVVNRMDEAKAVLPAGRAEQPQLTPAAGAGKVVLIVFSGQGPHKVQDVALVPTPHGPVSIAFPRIMAGNFECESGTFSLTGDGGTAEQALTPAADINRIAQQTLEDRRGRIIAKAVARAVAKQVVISGIANTQKGREAGQGVASLLNLANVLFLEKADTRSWRTLPGRILVGRAFAAPGDYTLQMRLCRNQARDLGSINIVSGQTRFLFADLQFAESNPQ